MHFKAYPPLGDSAYLILGLRGEHISLMLHLHKYSSWQLTTVDSAYYLFKFSTVYSGGMVLMSYVGFSRSVHIPVILCLPFDYARLHVEPVSMVFMASFTGKSLHGDLIYLHSCTQVYIWNVTYLTNCICQNQSNCFPAQSFFGTCSEFVHFVLFLLLLGCSSEAAVIMCRAVHSGLTRYYIFIFACIACFSSDFYPRFQVTAIWNKCIHG
jgi:hypothetical protein